MEREIRKPSALLRFPVACCLLPFALLTILFSSCKKGEQFDCIKSTGKIVREERMVGSFKTVSLENNIHLILTNDTTGKIIVEAGENLLKKIKTIVTGDKLDITNDNTCNWVRSYKKEIKVYVGIKNVYDVFHWGYGDISSEGTLIKDRLTVHHYSSGDIRLNINASLFWLDMDRLGNFILEGKTDTLLAYTFGLGQLRSENLSSHVCYIIHKGDGDLYVRSDNVLGAEIKNRGNIFYYGNPGNIDLTRTGTGNLIKGD